MHQTHFDPLQHVRPSLILRVLSALRGSILTAKIAEDAENRAATGAKDQTG